MKLIVVITLIFLSALGPAFAKASDLADYDELKHRVRQALAEGRERTADAVERERVRTAWEVGQLIDAHILLHKERADYGERVLERLAADLKISLTELRYMVQFARAYPIRPHAGELSWGEYRDLLSINDGQKREALAKQAAKENWSRETLRREIEKIRAVNASAFPADEPLVPLKGALNTYRVVTAVAGTWKGKPVIDLGFSNYYLPADALVAGRPVSQLKEGDIVQVSKSGKLELVKSATGSLAPLQRFSYRAYLLDVTDGDTLWVLIDLGFGFTTKQHVRLRGLDAPEISSRDGQAAKRFVEQELSRSVGRGTRYVTIASTRSDKYDRYLADVFYQTRKGEQFLNNRLLEERLAARV